MAQVDPDSPVDRDFAILESCRSSPRPTSAAALVVSLLRRRTDEDVTAHSAGDVYERVVRAFRPLLAKYGPTSEIDRPESRLDFAVRQARRMGLAPIHLSFAALHEMYLTAQAPNVAYVLWDYPDLPGSNDHESPRQNWVRIANRCRLVLTASTFARDAFRRAGVATPVAVIPVPITQKFFEIEPWKLGREVVLDCPGYWLPQEARLPQGDTGASRADELAAGVWARRAWRVYGSFLGRFPYPIAHAMHGALRAPKRLIGRVRSMHSSWTAPRLPLPRSSSLRLSGIVYTSIFNPCDESQNWRDLLTAFLHAFKDHSQATLVLNLMVRPEASVTALNAILAFHRGLGFAHRCRVALIAGELAQDVMLKLAEATACYVNTSRAETVCLPLQNFLAAGRSGVCPTHTSLGDYHSIGLGWEVASAPEPTYFPDDPERRQITTWHRLNWASLRDELRKSFTAMERGADNDRRARRARECMAAYAGQDMVWRLLQERLDSCMPDSRGGRTESPGWACSVKRAS